MKKTFSVFLIFSVISALSFALNARAGWTPDPLDVQVLTPVATATVASTGTVTVVSVIPDDARYAISLSAGTILPSSTNETATFTRISSGGATTNTYAFTNGAASSSAGVWFETNDTITVTLSGTVTNLPVLTYTYIGSPATTNVTCMAGDQWLISGARPSSAILPTGATNTLSASYTGGAAESLATFTNGGAAYLPATPVWLSLFDSVTLSLSRCTNSPSFRVMRQRWID